MLSLKSEKPATAETVNELLSSTRPARIVDDANNPDSDDVQRRSRSESDDNYEAVIAILTDRWRVIECRDRIQWILQYRASAETYSTAHWVGRSYCRSRDALIRCCISRCGTVHGLGGLPEWCEPQQ